MDDRRRRIALGLALLAITGLIVAIEAPWAARSAPPPPPEDIPVWALEYLAAADFGGATGWATTDPIRLEDLRGQVVLVDFWTYSCINCIHTFPYIRAWHELYADHGLVIVGVHTPEFAFERDADNVREAMARNNLTHPVALDNDYRIWRAYHNRYWPAKYLIDEWGRIRHTSFGEGGYVETEDKIRELLAQSGHALPASRVGLIADAGYSGGGVHSPELYAAAAQGPDRVSIGNEEGYHPGRTIAYEDPATVDPDRIYLVGTWRNGEEKVTAVGDARVIVWFRAGGANFVADGPRGSCVRVALDDAPITREQAGQDVSFGAGEPCIALDGPRSYDFYAGPRGWHTVELSVPDGFQLFTFAFSAEAGEAR